MNDWQDDLAELATRGESSVLVTVAGVRGSAPRETGAKMIVTAQETIGTIGGGQLEYQCTRIAVEKLKDEAGGAERRIRRRFALGANCGQCCGGVVDVIFERVEVAAPWLAELRRLYAERIPVVLVTPDDGSSGLVLVTADRVRPFDAQAAMPAETIMLARRLIAEDGRAMCRDGFLFEPVVSTRFNIAVFGAGHVGAATVEVLARLDCQLRWIDSRRGVLPQSMPRNVTAIESGNPALEVAAMPPGTLFLVMTHSHPLDFEICERILRRGDAAYCGLIGSVSKRRRFERSMRKLGLPDAALERLTCPIGVAGIVSKKPSYIAIAVAAEILRARDAAGVTIQDNESVQHNSKTNVHAI
jgi:xanthine dehydrogenase accessory factor